MKPKLATICKPMLVRHRGRFLSMPTTTKQTIGNSSTRTINANCLHQEGSAEFWMKRRTYRRGYTPQYFDFFSQTMMPSWDRLAQALLLMVQPVKREPAANAFRLFVMFLKMQILHRIATTNLMMLPLSTSINLQAVLEEAKREAEKTQEKEAADSSSTEKKE